LVASTNTVVSNSSGKVHSQRGAARALRDGEHAACRAEAAVERELARHSVLGERLPRHLPRRGEDGERDRQVESRTLLAQRGGREVDRDLALRPPERGGRDAASHAVLRLLARAVGEADDREAGHAAVQVGLDLHPPRVQPDDRVRDDARHHLPNVWRTA
jgi:hypothetical protein